MSIFMRSDAGRLTVNDWSQYAKQIQKENVLDKNSQKNSVNYIKWEFASTLQHYSVIIC